MKKSKPHKRIKLLLLLVFCGFALWFFASPRTGTMVPQPVAINVEPVPVQELPVMPETTGSEDNKLPDKPAEPPRVTKPAPVKGHPKIAIVIDDMGLDSRGSPRAVKLPLQVTLSYIPYAPHLRDQTRAAQSRGHELLLHMPMEPLGHADPGQGALLVSLSPDEIRQRLDDALDSFAGFDGMNNHMGSKFTAYADGMKIVMDELKARHIFFLDSRTSPQTIGAALAKENGIPTLSRDIFLDDDMAASAVRHQLQQTERVAQRHGYAIAIGHPHAATLQELEPWLVDIQSRGFELVALHDLLKDQSYSP